MSASVKKSPLAKSHMIRPGLKSLGVERLKPGATIGIIAPGGPLNPERFRQGINELERRGYRAKYPIDPGQYYGDYTHGFTNGSARDRAQALMDLIEDPEVSAIIAARGAYGTLDILPLLDFDRILKARKLIVGYSDITALLFAVHRNTELFAIHGSTIGSEFADGADSLAAKESLDALFSLLSNPEYRLSASCDRIRDGVGEGPIIAGNLTMLATMLGTPWDLDYKDSVLVIEDVGEAPYRVHRALSQLKLAGKLKSLSALVFGRFANCSASAGPTIEEVIQNSVNDIVSGTEYPIISGFEFGHRGKNLPLALGCRANVSGSNFQVIESPLI